MNLTIEKAKEIVADHNQWRASQDKWPTSANPHDFDLVTYSNGFIEGWNQALGFAAEIADRQYYEGLDLHKAISLILSLKVKGEK